MKKYLLVPLALVLSLTTVSAQQRPLADIAADLDRLANELRGATSTTTTGTTYTPATGADLANVFTTAKAGDVIKLTPGVTYTGEFHLPVVSGGVVTVTSNSTLPDRRITPADAPLLATLDAGVLAPAIDGTNARGWKFDGVRFSTPYSTGDVVVLFDSEDITFDRVLILGGAAGQKRGIRGNGKNITVTRSYIANIWVQGQDTQAFCAWDGAGPYTLRDNYLEASGENVMFGGADMRSVDNIPSDILIEGNTLEKPASWQGDYTKTVKNLLEFKVGKRIVVRNNTLNRNWTMAQNGYAVVLKVANQDGGNPWNVLEDFLFEGNTILNTENGINILGNDYGQPSGRLTRLTIQHNTITVSGVGFQAGGEAGEVTVKSNTVQNGYTLFQLYKGDVWNAGTSAPRPGAYAIEHFTFANNVGNHNDYGFKGEGTASGNPTLAIFTPAAAFTSNVLIDYLYKASYPTPTWNSLAEVPAGTVVGR